MKLQILKLNGDKIGLKEAVLRKSVDIILAVIGLTATFICIRQMDAEAYKKNKWFEKSKTDPCFASLFLYLKWIGWCWTYSEFLALLTNERRRSLQDFIASTVIVKRKYVPQVQAEMKNIS